MFVCLSLWCEAVPVQTLTRNEMSGNKMQRAAKALQHIEAQLASACLSGMTIALYFNHDLL